jgi:vancomycin permeability regulator SanA
MVWICGSKPPKGRRFLIIIDSINILKRMDGNMKRLFRKKIVRSVAACVFSLGFLALISALGLNFYVVAKEKGRILLREDAAALSDIDCILVLGAGVWADGKPSHMLEDRILESVALYEAGAAGKLLMSGDHGRAEYDEVNTMKHFAATRGVPAENIFMDHAGFSTYESIYRAKEIFGVNRIIIVTQKYHLYRALYVAEQFGLEAFGVASDPRGYAGQTFRDIREIAARNKDFFFSIFKPSPTYLGEAIPVSGGNGNITNDAPGDIVPKK